MVDQESRSYRPRRAFIEPEAEPTPPPAPDPAPAPATVSRPAAPNFDDEDAPKPLYRDEYLPRTLYRPERTSNGSETIATPVVNGGAPAVNGGAVSPPAAPPRPDADDVGSDDTAIRSFTFAPRTRRTGDETTTILTRSGSTARGRIRTVRPFRSRRPRRVRTRRTAGRSASGPAGPWPSASSLRSWCSAWRSGRRARPGRGEPGYRPASRGDGRLGGPGADDQRLRAADHQRRSAADQRPLLSAAQAKPLDPKRTWKETLTQWGASEDAPVPACFVVEPPNGQPVSQQKILRVLSSNGKSAPSALHDVTAYASPEEAVQAYAAAVPHPGHVPGCWGVASPLAG